MLKSCDKRWVTYLYQNLYHTVLLRVGPFTEWIKSLVLPSQHIEVHWTLMQLWSQKPNPMLNILLTLLQRLLNGFKHENEFILLHFTPFRIIIHFAEIIHWFGYLVCAYVTFLWFDMKKGWKIPDLWSNLNSQSDLII